MRTKKAFVLFLVLLFSGSCRQYEVGGELAYSLDDALSMARDRCPGDIYRCYSYWPDLEKLWEQAEENDREVIEREMLTFLLKRLEDYGDPGGRTSVTLRILGEEATSDDIKKAATKALLEYELAQKQQAEQQQELEQKQAENIRLAFRESRKHLLRVGAGRLDDKSAEQVRQLVYGWTQAKGVMQLV
ncbi:MAG: hypothetical protein ACYS0H_21975 [Planctomycetota bacterium]|jgi:hypothetical protein